MKCAKIKRRLSAYLDGELDAATAEMVTDHLRRCTNCSAEAERLQRAYYLLGEGSELPADPFFVTRLRARLSAADGGTISSTLQRWTWRLVMPAAVVVGLFFGVMLGTQIQQNWLGAQWNSNDDFSGQFLYETQKTLLTTDYLALNGWAEVQNEE